MNNSGIYQGLPRDQYDDIMKNEDPFIKLERERGEREE